MANYFGTITKDGMIHNLRFNNVIRPLANPRYGRCYTVDMRYFNRATMELNVPQFFDDLITKHENLKNEFDHYIQTFQVQQSKHNTKYDKEIRDADTFFEMIKLLFAKWMTNFRLGKQIDDIQAIYKKILKKIEILQKDKIQFAADRETLYKALGGAISQCSCCFVSEKAHE